MDALDALEIAEDLATPTRGCKRPPDEAMTPKVLASRRRLLFQKDELADEAGVDKAEATEGSPMVDKASALVGDATSTHGTDRNQGIKCHGCTRTPVCNDFVRAGDVVSWALPDNRGCWCKDCYTVYRTYYNRIKSLTMFNHWLRSEDANRHQFVQVLIAYLFPRTRGRQADPQGHTRKRLTCLRWMKPSKAVQLDGTLMRKLCPEDQVRWPPSCLFQSKGGSKDALLAGMVAAPGFSGSSEPVSSLVGVTTRVSIQARECAQFLTVTFGCRLWSDLCRESAFTPYLAKLSATRLEGLGEGNKHVETESNSWLVGLSAGKGFVRLWRIYSKHRKHLQYMACEFTCRSFVDFLHEKGIDVHIGLELNNIKLAFYRGMEGESSNISKVIAHFMESGLDMLIGTAFRTSASSESIDRAVDPDVWLRDVFPLVVPADGGPTSG
jgi:hypothetical protein